MGDIWPYGPPRYTNWTQCYDAMLKLGFTKADANIMAAIAGADGGYDLSVINDTPATGDYSVGTWQINYYGSLYAGRVAEFGTPKQLIDGGLSDQASAAHQVWAEQGFAAWGAYDNGSYRKFLNNTLPSGPGPAHQAQLPGHTISPPTEDYSPTVRLGAGHLNILAEQFRDGADRIAALLK